MTTVHVHRADATRTEPVAAALIAIDLTQPAHDRDSDYAATAQAMFDGDAKAIADVQHAALPGGTLKALMAELLTREVCLLRVPMPGATALEDAAWRPRSPGWVERPAPVGSWWQTEDGVAYVDGDLLDGPGDQIVTYVLHRPDGGRSYGKWGGREFADAYTRLDGPPAWCVPDSSEFDD